MVTHNMQQALTMGNRTLMMDDGRIVFDVKGEERSRMDRAGSSGEVPHRSREGA